MCGNDNPSPGHYYFRIGCYCENCRRFMTWCEREQMKKDNALERRKHLEDIAILNQNGRGK